MTDMMTWEFYKHPARLLRYSDLEEGLAAAREAKLVSEKRAGDLSLFCYTQAAVYDRQWTPFTLMARGLILDRERRIVVATPFEKFFNLGEREQPLPDYGFDILEKLDGSLIIIWHDPGTGWRCATKGSFDSEQARAAQQWLSARDLSALRPGTTYLAEWVAPDNRIVVPYAKTELVLLSVIEEEGNEWSYALLTELAGQLGWRVAKQYHFDSIADLVAHATQLPATEEGFVLRWQNGLRLKIKGDEYRRIHALISRCTPLAMWEAMAAGDNMDLIRQQLPEEFWGDFDAITGALSRNVGTIIERVRQQAETVAAWSDKEVGLRLNQWEEPIRAFIFPYRKNGGDLLSGKARAALFRAIRPTGNALDGYTPSYAMNRVMDDAAG